MGNLQVKEYNSSSDRNNRITGDIECTKPSLQDCTQQLDSKNIIAASGTRKRKNKVANQSLNTTLIKPEPKKKGVEMPSLNSKDAYAAYLVKNDGRSGVLSLGLRQDPNVIKEIENITKQRIAIHPMITRQKLRTIPKDEVDNYMMQAVRSGHCGKVTRINGHDFHKRIIYKEALEMDENEIIEGSKDGKSLMDSMTLLSLNSKFNDT